jgi:Uma2 family endonuclease
MAVQIKPKITEEDLLALGDDVRAEVEDGEIVIDMTPNKMDHTIYGTQLLVYLNTFVRLRNLGWVGGDMTAFKLEEDPTGGIKGARVPDLFYISYQRLPADADIAILPSFAPDLAVEVISESESHTNVLKKTNDYLDHGAAQVWHVIPALRQVHVFTASNRAGTILSDSDTLTAGDLLPGFGIPVQAIFDTSDAALHGDTLRRLMP